MDSGVNSKTNRVMRRWIWSMARILTKIIKTPMKNWLKIMVKLSCQLLYVCGYTTDHLPLPCRSTKAIGK